MLAYFMKCRTKKVMTDPKQITMKNGKPATQGESSAADVSTTNEPKHIDCGAEGDHPVDGKDRQLNSRGADGVRNIDLRIR